MGNWSRLQAEGRVAKLLRGFYGPDGPPPDRPVRKRACGDGEAVGEVVPAVDADAEVGADSSKPKEAS